MLLRDSNCGMLAGKVVFYFYISCLVYESSSVLLPCYFYEQYNDVHLLL